MVGMHRLRQALERPDQFSSSPLAFKAGNGGTVALFRFGAAGARSRSSDVIEAYKAKRWPEGRLPGGRG